MTLRVEHHKLKKARDIIASGWAKDAFARNSAGEACDLDDPDAKSFCLIGAMKKADCRMSDIEVVRRVAFKDYVFPIPVGALLPWNNLRNQTQESVLKVLDEAVELTLDGYEIDGVFTGQTSNSTVTVSEFNGEHPDIARSA